MLLLHSATNHHIFGATSFCRSRAVGGETQRIAALQEFYPQLLFFSAELMINKKSNTIKIFSHKCMHVIIINWFMQ